MFFKKTTINIPCHVSPRLLATGDGTGVIKVFSLSSELTQQTTGEIDYLASLVSDAMSIVV